MIILKLSNLMINQSKINVYKYFITNTFLTNFIPYETLKHS